MARHYSPRSFFRHAPHAMLVKYFTQNGVLTGHDFSRVSEIKIEPIYQAWLQLPDNLRGRMERDLKEIDALACEGGLKAIIDEADFHEENITEILDQHKDFHEKAFWVFLERPTYWSAASAFCRTDSISSSQWNECRTISNTPAKIEEADIQSLEKVLSQYFHSNEGCGKNCTVEPYRRGKLDCFLRTRKIMRNLVLNGRGDIQAQSTPPSL